MATDPRRKAAEKSIDDDAKARADSVAASEQIMASQPTPTQREADLAKDGRGCLRKRGRRLGAGS
jgi:hypothetical protein